ncbi:hypothetical protein ACRXAU_001650 [Yersinia enterocolitica]|uniref:hypothetical protein n=1 Tax=Yersinia mollaretii TaxID=33060 RepID=UPI001643BEC0|nr:hypothetical protein [Yersinia mollaretii]EKN4004232.1 hypothetical protein [Yersinia enterocolitica]EKN4906274.1 hypothetical protein [Yersinia enterocolitica]HDL7413979.1 hypothetical protein [Yersinia enterocolitica]HDL7635220.1 hypothetical protein [Yersinia enterocolitica]HDL8099875.1 hypothetical protein [Yersinia enterocolitica]
MTQEEKVLFLMKLSVETATAFRTSPKITVSSHDFFESVDGYYEKFEAILNEKLDEISG